METPVVPPSVSDRYPRIANPIHTVFVLAALGAWAFAAKVLADQSRAAANSSRVRLYVMTLVVEWIFFGLVLAGVRWSGASVFLVLGERWHSFRQVLRDIGIAAAFWVVAAMLLWVIGALLRTSEQARNMQFILPHGGTEIALWIALSITAGICEETIFRGYLQRQFMALTTSASAGIVLSAAAFGVAHAYQGYRMVILIAIYGSMFGVLAHWRGTVRPGMIAHAWQDSLGGVVSALTRH